MRCGRGPCEPRRLGPSRAGGRKQRRLDGRRGRARRRVLADRLPGRPTATPASSRRPASRSSPRCRSSATGPTAPPARCKLRAVPHHRRHPVRARPRPATAARSRRSPRTPRAEGYAITLIPVDVPDPGQRARRVHPAGRARRRRRHRHHGGPPARRRDRGAAARTCTSSSSTPTPATVPASSTPTRPTAPGRPSGTCSTSATARSGTSPARAESFASERRAEAWRAELEAAGRPGAAGRARRLVGRVRLPGRPAAGRATRLHRRLRGQRPDGPRRAARPARDAAAGARRRQRGRLRRHPRRVLLPAPADHRAPGLRRGRPALRAGPASRSAPTPPSPAPPSSPPELLIRAKHGGPEGEIGHIHPGIGCRAGTLGE